MEARREYYWLREWGGRERGSPMPRHEGNMRKGLMSAPCGGKKGLREGWMGWTCGCGLETVRGGTSSAEGGAGRGGARREGVGGRKGALALFLGGGRQEGQSLHG